MASIKAPKVVSVVRRSPATAKAPAKAAARASLMAANKGIVKPSAAAKKTAKPAAKAAKAPAARKNGTASAKQLKAAASRKAARKALPVKKKAVNTVVPKVEREKPHVLKSTEGQPLAERLNPTLLEQLRTRKVTNAAAAEALGVHETYLSRTLTGMGFEKTKGITTEHREGRNKLTEARNQQRTILAKQVNRGELSVEKAAKDAGCSIRTMFRWCEKYANVGRKAA